MTFDARPYVEHYRAENEKEKQRIRVDAERARGEARRLAGEIMRSGAGVRAVILFGSLAEGEPRNAEFDIDLAIDGGDLYRVLDCTEASEFEVDVVQLDRVAEHVLARIRSRGVVLSP